MITGPRSQRAGVSNSQDGFIVVATLWLLAGLAALATVASVYIAQSAHTIAALDVATQWEMLGTAGVELAAYELSAPATVRRPTHGGFAFRLANSSVRVEYMSESARINLNMAPRAMIAGLFRGLGAQADAADEYAERVVAWRRTPKSDGQDTEQALYGASGVSYVPRQAPFSSADELWLVLGLPVALVERAMPFVTVYSGMAEINVLDAAPEVIAALPGMTPAKLDAFLNQRADLPPDNPEFVIGALGGKQPGATVSASEAYRVRVRITLADGRQRTPEAVIQIPPAGEKQAFRVLAWTDEIDPERAGRPRPMESR
ncbi:general secretion pathway protein GspK [Bradyrhizobium centrolobii]|uniref:General secretion pathway protein GspK n=1 Tax=Bradyrhizobium centrolobii TaxID=1505087 RepID=A0A176Z812_9BRAD|nr:type II secretion system protein GspK [Bradyrhizobium centrolobii]OAF15856.1 general secretion pathway protein GspK [Bradyrhizobium centrolobii]